MTKNEDLTEVKALNLIRGHLKTNEPIQFTSEDWRFIRDEVYSRFSEDSWLLESFRAVDRQFSRGERCGVCGRTEKQNENLGYDCSSNC